MLKTKTKTKVKFPLRPPGTFEERMVRVRALEAKQAPIYFIPEPQVPVKDHGYRVAIVVAGEDGYHWTGTWPYTGAPGETMPYFFGFDLQRAKERVKALNERMGISEEDAFIVVGRSMARGTGRKVRS